MKKLEEFTVFKSGILGLVLTYLEKLGFKELFYDGTKDTHKKNIHHYQRSLILICGRLDGGQPIYRVQDWYERSSVSQFLKLSGADLCESNLASTLEFLGERGSEIFNKLSCQIIKDLNLNKGNLCLDVSNVSFEGGYEKSDIIKYGYNRDKRRDKKQLNFGLGTLHRIPIFAEILSGNSNDHRIISPFLAVMKSMDWDTLLSHIVLDRIFSDRKTLTELSDAGLHFIVGVDGKYHKIDFSKIDKSELQPIYREGYSGCILEEKLYGKYKQFLIFSEELKRSKSATLTKQKEKVINEFNSLISKSGKWIYINNARITERAEKILQKYPNVRRFFSYQVKNVSFSYSFDDTGFEDKLKTLGYYIIGSNNLDLTVEAALTDYKGRDSVEKVIELSKKNYKISPFCLSKDERIKGMMWIILLGALIISSIEHKVNADKMRLEKVAFSGKVSRPVKQAFKQYKVVRWFHLSRELDILQILYVNGNWRFMTNTDPLMDLLIEIFNVSAQDIYNTLWKGS